eukprot:COSAG01_NODE_44687_length_416_cov_1.460568_1_plen_73_part_10
MSVFGGFLDTINVKAPGPSHGIQYRRGAQPPVAYWGPTAHKFLFSACGKKAVTVASPRRAEAAVRGYGGGDRE